MTESEGTWRSEMQMGGSQGPRVEMVWRSSRWDSRADRGLSLTVAYTVDNAFVVGTDAFVYV